jgi:uncharacterized protein (UPF0332 family)
VSFDWHELLALASGLASGPSEAQKRAAISRAYYAAFHVVRKSLQIMAVGEASHQVVWDRAKSDAREEVRLAGRSGARLKTKRVAADYHPTVDFLDYMVKESLELARSICNRVDPRPVVVPTLISSPSQPLSIASVVPSSTDSDSEPKK